ncbi:hypothetical protein NPIL_420241 [Nephila pilipes]|uniref:Uncharacterized protein n=1 Tax=Nephila pilipes TaxID=299642 RepID=A0A8X6JCI8_NEPPI|nr:hypothetical protein NPIL_420241 [Nephila pilipes]
MQEARLKFRNLKSAELQSEMFFFNEISEAWGLNRDQSCSEFKTVSRKSKTKKPTKQNSQNVKRLKISIHQNQFEVLSTSEDDENQLQNSSAPKNTPSTSKISVNRNTKSIKKHKVVPITLDNLRC